VLQAGPVCRILPAFRARGRFFARCHILEPSSAFWIPSHVHLLLFDRSGTSRVKHLARWPRGPTPPFFSRGPQIFSHARWSQPHATHL
jgi:hypothetical protein